eukprot:TRINITY_DN9038_c0_g1_i18.p1 TRINITY_DN9038_c0_g1~~TRINITY_DN9038_c0_g1_i18.p1  ORF type:complete len:176 (-),score=30.12 TRINITY_DN9038_c0_g1_i18:129-656(-)
MLSQSIPLYPNTILSNAWSKNLSHPYLGQGSNYVEKENAYRDSVQSKYKYKTELCKNWEERGYCPYGAKCRFAHGARELNSKEKINDKYKSKPCQAFFSTMFCSYGNRCLFKHDERAIKDINRVYYATLNKYPSLWEAVTKRRLPVFAELAREETNNQANVCAKDILQSNKRFQV